ncbi:MAG: ketohexokinase [Gammaproteobacteria bacterium]|nr:ketohexokinase [Gammaproteobacteria bacterium]
MARILAVGIATLDIINSVDGYPQEDDEVRATAQRRCRGGNATNTLVILSRLGHHCAWAGVLADEADAREIETDLSRHSIDLSAVMTVPQGKVPTSYVTHNTRNGSRTIVHYRDLPEYPASAFEKINLGDYDWLHFEGRNVDGAREMMTHARRLCPQLPISLEVEKDRPGKIDSLFVFADVLLFSRPFARGRGFEDGATFLQAMRKLAPQARLTCTWGEYGAYGLDRNGKTHHSPAFPPPRLVDTLGAGDTFNAGMIDALIDDQNLEAALTHACTLAGHKCGIEGLNL